MPWRPQRDPDQSHEPQPGDGYVEPIHGVVVRVDRIEAGRVHFSKSNGWRASMALDDFKTRCRRLVRE